MNNYFIYYIGIAALVFVIYTLSKKYTKSLSANATASMEKTYARHANNSNELIQSILQDKEWFAPIKEKLEGETIVGITECLPIKSMGDWLKKAAANEAGRTLGKITGVRITQVEAPYSYYLVLSQNHLHYMAYEKGICKEHLYFDVTTLQDIQWREATYKDVLVYEGMATSGSCKKLSFHSNNKDYALLVHNFIVRNPNQEFADNEMANLQLYALRKAFEQQLGKQALSYV